MPWPQGRKPEKKFQTAEDLENAVNSYFIWCDEQREIVTDSKGNTKVVAKPYTITGLCVYIGITRDTFISYSKDPVLENVIAMAKLRVENYIEENSLNGKVNPIMSIFNLKNNFGWVDRVEVNNSQSVEVLDASDIKRMLGNSRKQLNE